MMQVFGVPDQRMGEEIAAWLRMAPGKEMAEGDVKSFLKGKVRSLTQKAKFLDICTSLAKVKLFSLSLDQELCLHASILMKYHETCRSRISRSLDTCASWRNSRRRRRAKSKSSRCESTRLRNAILKYNWWKMCILNIIVINYKDYILVANCECWIGITRACARPDTRLW